MRRIVLISLLLPSLLFAQTRSGPRAGLSLATISSGQLFQWNGLPQVGPILGYSFEVKWTEQAAFLIEPMYISKGSFVRNAQFDQNTSTRYGYLELPVILKLSLGKDPGGIFLSGGIMGGYWLTGRQVSKVSGITQYNTQYDLSQANRRFQYGVALGLGVDKGNFSFEARVQTSLSPFKAVYQAQNLVIGLHFTYYIPKKADRDKKKEKELE